MGIYFLDRRRKIEGVYRELEFVKSQMKSLIMMNTEQLTSDNIRLLELEEEKLLGRIVQLKNMT